MAALLKLRSSVKGRGHLLRDATRKSVPWPQAPLPIIPMAKPNQKPKHQSLMQSLTVQPPQAQNWLELGEWTWRGRWKLSSADVVKEIPVLNGTSLSFPLILQNSLLWRIIESQKYLRLPSSSTQKMQTSYSSQHLISYFQLWRTKSYFRKQVVLLLISSTY